MPKQFSTVVKRAIALQGNRSTSQFARDIGIQQSTLDLYLKGKRKPSLELIYGICRNCHVSADWLLGLTEEGTIGEENAGNQVAPDSSGAAAGVDAREDNVSGENEELQALRKDLAALAQRLENLSLRR